MALSDELGFEIEVVYEDAVNYPADVLAVVYPQEWTTLGRQILKGMPPSNPLSVHPPKPGETQRFPSAGATKAETILLIGTAAPRDLTYNALRQAAHRMLAALCQSDAKMPAEHVAVTVFGSGWGFDEVEAFRAMLLGFLDAVHDKLLPAHLKRLTVLEHRLNRANVLAEALARFWQQDARTFPADNSPPGANEQPVHFERQEAVKVEPGIKEPIEPIASLDEPSVFVAMPFAPHFDDIYYYAILPSVKANNAQCIRLDKVAYTGDVIETIKVRIKDAELVVAVLDGLNPNVFLEIGYAWGVNVPTLLLISDEQLEQMHDKLPFDVISQRYIRYESIRALAERLPDEIKGAFSGSPAASAAKPPSPR